MYGLLNSTASKGKVKKAEKNSDVVTVIDCTFCGKPQTFVNEHGRRGSMREIVRLMKKYRVGLVCKKCEAAFRE